MTNTSPDYSLVFNSVHYHVAHVCAQSLSHVQLSATPRTVAHQAALSMGFSRQEYWSGCHAILQGTFPTQ